MSELVRYHKYETDSMDLKVFIDVIKKMKQLEVLFPGQGAADDHMSHDATSIDSNGSFSGPQEASDVFDTVWVSDIREYTSEYRDITCSIRMMRHMYTESWLWQV